MSRTKGATTLRSYGKMPFDYGYRFAVAHLAATRTIDGWLGRGPVGRTAADQAVLMASLRPMVLRFNPTPEGEETGGSLNRKSPVRPDERQRGRFEIAFEGDRPGRAVIRSEGEKALKRLKRLDELEISHPDRVWLAYSAAVWVVLMQPRLANQNINQVVHDLYLADPAPIIAASSLTANNYALSNLCVEATGEAEYWLLQRERFLKTVHRSTDAEKLFTDM